MPWSGPFQLSRKMGNSARVRLKDSMRTPKSTHSTLLTGKFQERKPFMSFRSNCKRKLLNCSFIHPFSMSQNESAIQLQPIVFDDLELLCIFVILLRFYREISKLLGIAAISHFQFPFHTFFFQKNCL